MKCLVAIQVYTYTCIVVYDTTSFMLFTSVQISSIKFAMVNDKVCVCVCVCLGGILSRPRLYNFVHLGLTTLSYFFGLGGRNYGGSQKA